MFEAFDKQAALIFDATHANGTKSRTLAALRDTLLPKLLSGELAVGAALREFIGSKESMSSIQCSTDRMNDVDTSKELNK